MHRKRRLAFHPFIVAVVVLLAATTTLLITVGGAPPPFPTPPPDDEVSVYVMGDTAAYLEVCGCDAALLGGYNRVAAHLRAQYGAPKGDGAPWVLLDSGNFLIDDGDLARMRARYALEVLGLLRPSAVNLGVRDLVFGAELLASASVPLPYVAAGVSKAGLEGGKLQPPAWRLIDADGLKLGVIGIGVGDDGKAVSEAVATRRVTAAAAAAKAAGARSLVLLADLDALTARDVAAAAGGMQAIVLSTGAHSEQARAGRGGPLITPGEKAYHLARLLFDRDTGELAAVEWTAMDITLDVDRPEDVQALVRSYREETRKLGVANKAERTRLANEGLDHPYVGSEACKPCHGAYDQPFDKWLDQENHFKAFRIFTEFERREAMRKVPTPDCVICHVVGFRKLRPDPAKPPKYVWFEEGVGCEVCHGPGSEHVKLPLRTNIQRGSVETAREEICVKCHVPDHSPKFEYLDYLRRIRHWDKSREDRLHSGEIEVPPGPPAEVPGKTLGLGKKGPGPGK